MKNFKRRANVGQTATEYALSVAIAYFIAVLFYFILLPADYSFLGGKTKVDIENQVLHGEAYEQTILEKLFRKIEESVIAPGP